MLIVWIIWILTALFLYLRILEKCSKRLISMNSLMIILNLLKVVFVIFVCVYQKLWKSSDLFHNGDEVVLCDVQSLLQLVHYSAESQDSHTQTSSRNTACPSENYPFSTIIF